MVSTAVIDVYGCVDQMFTVRVLAENVREFSTPLYLCFVDLK